MEEYEVLSSRDGWVARDREAKFRSTLNWFWFNIVWTSSVSSGHRKHHQREIWHHKSFLFGCKSCPWNPNSGSYPSKLSLRLSSPAWPRSVTKEMKADVVVLDNVIECSDLWKKAGKLPFRISPLKDFHQGRTWPMSWSAGKSPATKRGRQRSNSTLGEDVGAFHHFSASCSHMTELNELRTSSGVYCHSASPHGNLHDAKPRCHWNIHATGPP